jgi:hypothetical protein
MDWIAVIDAAVTPGMSVDQQDRLTIALGGSLRYDTATRRLRVTLRTGDDTPVPGTPDVPAAASAAVKAVTTAAEAAGLTVTVDGVRIAAPDTFERETLAPVRLAGITEIGGILGLTRQGANNATKDPTFPEPLADLAGGRVYDADAVEAYARQRTEQRSVSRALARGRKDGTIRPARKAG